MAEILSSGLLASLFGGGSAAGAATTAAVGTAAASSSALSILQGVATAVTALGAIGSGISAMNTANAEANATELQAGQELLAGEQRRMQRTRELMRILGENDVAFAAGGVDVAGGGIASATRQQIRQEATFDMNIDRSQDEYRRALLQVRARNMRRRGGEQFGAGLLGALNAGLGFGMDMYERGV